MNAPQADLQAAVKAVLLLRSEMTDRENRMHKAIQQEMGTLRYKVSQVKREVSTLVSGAGARIVEQARDAVAPTAAQYDRAVQAASSRLQGTGRLVWLWFGTAIGAVLLVLIAGWAVLVTTGVRWRRRAKRCSATRTRCRCCRPTTRRMPCCAMADCAWPWIATHRHWATKGVIARPARARRADPSRRILYNAGTLTRRLQHP